MTNSKTDSGVKATIVQLIEVATQYDTATLDLIYHENLKVIMLDQKDQKSELNKKDFKNIFDTKRKNGDLPLNTWVKFHHIACEGLWGHAILSRKVNLTGSEQEIKLNIDLIWEENRWQVIREVIFV